MMDNPALARQCNRRTGRGGLGPRPAVPRAVALITTAGFWATCAALAQPSRAAVSYAQAEDACTEGTAGRGSKALRRLLSKLVSVRPNDKFVNCRSGDRSPLAAPHLLEVAAPAPPCDQSVSF